MIDWAAVRQRVGGDVIEAAFRLASGVARLHPKARPSAWGVERIADIAYGPARPHHLLDVYRPTKARKDAPLPVVFYVHGGGFRILSKDTHWPLVLAFAARGYVVITPNYRLAPTTPFPGGLQDVLSALEWALDNASHYGGDPARMFLAGESAGANLATATVLATHYRRPEPWAQRLFDRGPRFVGVCAAAGLFDVTHRGHRGLTGIYRQRLEVLTRGYIRDPAAVGDAVDLADVVCFLERGEAPDVPLPPFHIFVGGKDPIEDDSLRLHAALRALGSASDLVQYPGGLHAFHALVFTAQSKRAWDAQERWMRGVLKTTGAATD